jgi:hypothetical protein
VRFDGRGAEEQAVADRLVRPAFGHEREHVALPRGEVGEAVLLSEPAEQGADDLGVAHNGDGPDGEGSPAAEAGDSGDGGDNGPTVYGDAAYGSGENLALLEKMGAQARTKVQRRPPRVDGSPRTGSTSTCRPPRSPAPLDRPPP